MIELLKKQSLMKVLFLIILIIIPFSISDYFDEVIPEKISSDLRFYEINTCSISLFEFLLHNPNVIYQDHYKIRFNNYSSIACFGQITGIDQLGYDFYISIGTNTLINLYLQSTVWLFLISFLPRKKIYEKLKILDYVSLVSTATILTGLIYSENRFYQNAFFELDLLSKKSYLYLYFYFFTIGYFSLNILNNRSSKIINFLPLGFLFIGLFSGMNFYFLSIYFCIIGIKYLFKNKSVRKIFSVLNFLIFFWSFNAIGMFYYLKPDKVRGLSHGDYNFLSVAFWSYFIIFSIIGLFFFIRNKKNSVNYESFKNNILISGFLILVLGYLGSSMPFFNFMNYYYFGQTKYGTTNQNLFSVDSWGVTEAWRGFFPSAETVGEFFALGILISFLYRGNRNSFLTYLGVFTLFFGLLASNNRAALFTLLLCIVLKINKENKLKSTTKFLIFIPVGLILLYFIRFENLLYSFDFSSNKIINMGRSYSLESNLSSSIQYLSNIEDKNFFIRSIFLLFGFLAFLINRSELWGIFLARFNPSGSELLFGTGPFILSNHYGEIDIFNKRVFTGTELGFLLPHSSLLLIFVFLGVIGGLVLILLMIKVLFEERTRNHDLFLITVFISINLIKSDSILYLPSLMLYLCFFILLSKKNLEKELF
tara:strand:+ start:1237 stop:3189 length:1953 start_codon:yes stop_codon:yes gene_type:complete